METTMDCCDDMRSLVTSRRALLLGGASFAAWAYLPKLAAGGDHLARCAGRAGHRRADRRS